jgi:hypothetical protein
VENQISLEIRKFRDNKKDEAVTVDDVPKSRFNGIEEVEYTDERYRRHRYRVYRYPQGSKPVKGQYKGFVTKYTGSFEEAPVNAFAREDGEIVVDEGQLVHQLVEEYGEGQFYVYRFGGNPNQETLFKAFVEVIS